MSGYYIYLISSLPILQFGIKPPFTFGQFLAVCQPQISAAELVILKSVSLNGEYAYADVQPTLGRWRAFNLALRNELVRIRAARRHLEPTKFLRAAGYTTPEIAHIAMNACKNPDILEAEKSLAQARWRMLDELSLGHYFDLDVLLIYAYKLLILERWERIRTVNGEHLLEAALTKVDK